MLHALVRRVLSRVVKRGNLVVTFFDGERMTFGDGTGSAVAVRFTDWQAEFNFLYDPGLRLGEAYVDGRLVVEQGSIYEFLSIVLAGAESVNTSGLSDTVDRWRFAAYRFIQRNGLAAARKNVAHHYDLDERLYALFLDGDWQYSCAYFETAEMSLEDAQLAKKRHIAAKLCLTPDCDVLDIGCGWGGLALYLAQVAGARRVHGITLSQEQLKIAHERAATSGLADRVTFALTDYREVAPRYNRIVSVGMFEHVGLRHYDAFFRKCMDILTEDGVMLLHTIGNSDEPSLVNPWISKYIFPGGHIPSLSDIAGSAERAGLVVTDVEVWRLHYAQTLRVWRARFLERRDEAAAIYDDRFCRMWEFYLSLAEAAFRYLGTCVFQVQLAKRQDNVPLTRDYIEREKARLRREEATRGNLERAAI